MKVINTKAEKDQNTGKNKILMEVDENDFELLSEIVARFEEEGKYDKDDNKIVQKLKHIKEQIHNGRNIVRPS